MEMWMLSQKANMQKYNSSTLTNTSKDTLTNTPKYVRTVISYRGSGYPGTWTACYAVESGRGSRWKIWKDKKVSSTNKKQGNITCKHVSYPVNGKWMVTSAARLCSQNQNTLVSITL